MSKDPDITYLAVQELKSQLPQLVDENNWPSVESKLAELDAQWAVAEEGVPRLRLAAEYRTLLADYPAAREKLRDMVRGPDVYHNSLLRLAELSDLTGDEVGAARLRDVAYDNSEARYIYEQGVGRKAYSVKLSNMDFRFWNLAPALGNILVAVDVYLDPSKSGLAIAAAVLSAIGTAGLLIEELSVDTTSVFLGMVQAANLVKEADLESIITGTNAERARIYMEPPLSDSQVKQALFELYQLRSIDPVDGQPDTWRVVEQHGRI